MYTHTHTHAHTHHVYIYIQVGISKSHLALAGDPLCVCECVCMCAPAVQGNGVRGQAGEKKALAQAYRFRALSSHALSLARTHLISSVHVSLGLE